MIFKWYLNDEATLAGCYKVQLQDVFDFRQGEAWSIFRADRVDEPSSWEENQSDHHLFQAETSFTRRVSFVFWPAWQPPLWWEDLMNTLLNGWLVRESSKWLIDV